MLAAAADFFLIFSTVKASSFVYLATFFMVASETF